MSLRSEKIKRLQGEQGTLKKEKSNLSNLQVQQIALRRGLTLKKPVFQDRVERVRGFKEAQRVSRDLISQRQKEEKERKRIFREVAERNKRVRLEYDKGLERVFFPRSRNNIKRRR